MRVDRQLLARAVAAAGTLLVVSTGEITKAQALASAPPVEELVRWLDQRETEWVATAHLQRQPEAAIPLLLAPGRVKVGPHGDWTPALLALAKIGEPAIPAILEQFETARRGGDPSAVNWQALVKVLAAIRPPAVPALVQIADIAPGALDAVAEMEPALPAHYSELLFPWASWRPADDRLSRLQTHNLFPRTPCSCLA